VFSPHNAEQASGYYLHIDPEGSFISCGHYMLLPDRLKMVRRGIYNDFELFQKIVTEKRFKKEFGGLYRDDDALQRVPNGFDKDHPAAEYLKLKHFYAYKPLSDNLLVSDKLVPYIQDMYKLMQPLNEFLNDLIVEE
jgi:uncharacterized protein (TIGR02453 family)